MFDAKETSARGGKPGHLFVFTRQSKVWRYASGASDVIVAGDTFTAAPVARSEIKQTLEKAQDKITITLPYQRDSTSSEVPPTQSLGDNWHPYIPSDTVSVTCLAYHANDPDSELAVEWTGIVAQPKFEDGKLELICSPMTATDRNKYQGAKWQRACWKTPYSTGLRGCNMIRANFELAATLTAVAGLVVSADEFATAPLSLAGAALSWTTAEGLTERRSVMAHSGTDITLLSGAADLAPGLAVVALPGCPRTWSACAARNNTDNYGGSVYKPVKNPYNGVSMSWG